MVLLVVEWVSVGALVCDESAEKETESFEKKPAFILYFMCECTILYFSQHVSTLTLFNYSRKGHSALLLCVYLILWTTNSVSTQFNNKPQHLSWLLLVLNPTITQSQNVMFVTKGKKKYKQTIEYFFILVKERSFQSLNMSCFNIKVFQVKFWITFVQFVILSNLKLLTANLGRICLSFQQQ